MKKGKTKICILCGKKYAKSGNNPSPLAEAGRCCDKCDDNKVLPARLMITGFSRAHAEAIGKQHGQLRTKWKQYMNENC